LRTSEPKVTAVSSVFDVVQAFTAVAGKKNIRRCGDGEEMNKKKDSPPRHRV